MKRLAIALLLCANAAAGQTYTGVSVGTVNTGVVARFDCRSFGQTATDGGLLNITQGSGIYCSAERSTVAGVAINATDWVPDVWVEWDWGDSEAGTALGTRGGFSAPSLNASIGVEAAHVVYRSTFGESCGSGGNNALQTLTVTVYSVIAGVRQSSPASMNYCVENPATTWPTPVAFCDDADCSNDAGVPAGTIHGGNGTDLATIMDYCDVNGTERVVVEGGVTFSSTADANTGNVACLIESYDSGGGARATLDFNKTNAAISTQVTLQACVGYRVHNVTFAGAGTSQAAGIFRSEVDGDGCLVVSDADTSVAANDYAGFLYQSTPDGYEIYLHRVSWDTNRATSGVVAFYGSLVRAAIIGGQITASGEHLTRLYNWVHVVVDAVKFANTPTGKVSLALRQDCGALSQPCPAFQSSHSATVSRSEFVANDNSQSVAIELCHDNSGATDQAVRCYDFEVLRTSFHFEAGSVPGSLGQFIDTDKGSCCSAPDTEVKRLRIVQNYWDLSTLNGGSGVSFAAVTDVWIDGNAASCVSCTTNTPTSLTKGSSLPGNTVVKNNVIWGSLLAQVDLFESYTEDTATNLTLGAGTDPWDFDGAVPGTNGNFDKDDVRITSANTAIRNTGVVTAYPTDFEGEAIPQAGNYPSGVDSE